MTYNCNAAAILDNPLLTKIPFYGSKISYARSLLKQKSLGQDNFKSTQKSTSRSSMKSLKVDRNGLDQSGSPEKNSSFLLKNPQTF